MFSKTQRYYDAVYSWKDYAAESARLLQIIDSHFPEGSGALLDVACGTGMHLEVLRSHLPVEGIDIDPDMVAIARQRNPGVPVHEAGMEDFDLGRQFGVVICMFSSIGYLAGVERLRRAVANFARHLRPGGLLLVEPWLDPDTYTRRALPDLFTVERDGLKIARMGQVLRVGERTTIRFDYLIARAEGVEHIVEEHQTWLFTRAQYEGAFRAAGLSVSHDPDGVDGRGLYIGTRQ